MFECLKFSASRASAELIDCVLSSNFANDSGWALFIEAGAERSYPVVLTNTTFVSGGEERAPEDGDLFINAGAQIDYGVCRPGYSPGEPYTSIPVNDGDFTGCPFRCSNGTYCPPNSPTFKYCPLGQRSFQAQHSYP